MGNNSMLLDLVVILLADDLLLCKSRLIHQQRPTTCVYVCGCLKAWELPTTFEEWDVWGMTFGEPGFCTFVRFDGPPGSTLLLMDGFLERQCYYQIKRLQIKWHLHVCFKSMHAELRQMMQQGGPLPPTRGTLWRSDQPAVSPVFLQYMLPAHLERQIAMPSESGRKGTSGCVLESSSMFCYTNLLVTLAVSVPNCGPFQPALRRLVFFNSNFCQQKQYRLRRTSNCFHGPPNVKFLHHAENRAMNPPKTKRFSIVEWYTRISCGRLYTWTSALDRL